MSQEFFNQRNGVGPERFEVDFDELKRFVVAGYRDPGTQFLLRKIFGATLTSTEGSTCPTEESGILAKFWKSTWIKIPKGRSFEGFLWDSNEAQLFTAIEFIFKEVRGAPVLLASLNKTWLERMNRYLPHYGPGFFMTADGKVFRRSGEGLDLLLEKGPPPTAEKSNHQLVEEAVARFRRGSSNRAERKLALSDLGKVLEFYRKKDLKKVVPREEEQRLFEFLNTFSVRHNDSVQKDDYDDVWLDWMFYRALATIHLYWDLVHGRDEPLPSQA